MELLSAPAPPPGPEEAALLLRGATQRGWDGGRTRGGGGAGRDWPGLRGWAAVAWGLGLSPSQVPTSRCGLLGEGSRAPPVPGPHLAFVFGGTFAGLLAMAAHEVVLGTGPLMPVPLLPARTPSTAVLLAVGPVLPAAGAMSPIFRPITPCSRLFMPGALPRESPGKLGCPSTMVPPSELGGYEKLLPYAEPCAGCPGAPLGPQAEKAGPSGKKLSLGGYMLLPRPPGCPNTASCMKWWSPLLSCPYGVR